MLSSIQVCDEEGNGQITWNFSFLIRSTIRSAQDLVIERTANQNHWMHENETTVVRMIIIEHVRCSVRTYLKQIQWIPWFFFLINHGNNFTSYRVFILTFYRCSSLNPYNICYHSIWSIDQLKNWLNNIESHLNTFKRTDIMSSFRLIQLSVNSSTISFLTKRESYGS